MQKPAFRRGDRVCLTSWQVVGEVVEIKQMQHPLSSGTCITYRLVGEGFHPQHFFSQSILSSAQPCPNCEALGWDWITGCEQCGLSSDDLE